MIVHQGVRGACGGTELLVGEVDRLVKLQMQFVSLRAVRRSASATVKPAELEPAAGLRL